MQLHWTYDPNIRLAKTVITDNLYYTTPDGGQTIHKYVEGKLDDTFHKYVDAQKFSEIGWTGDHSERDTSWESELIWLSDTYPDIVGILHRDWKDGFINSKGELEDVGVSRGNGVNNPNDKISVNRLCCPANESEWWDWDIIAMTGTDVAEDCMGRGTIWRKHKESGEIIRTSNGTPPYPCCVHPVIHGPFVVDDSDITEHGGTRFDI